MSPSASDTPSATWRRRKTRGVAIALRSDLTLTSPSATSTAMVPQMAMPNFRRMTVGMASFLPLIVLTRRGYMAVQPDNDDTAAA